MPKLQRQNKQILRPFGGLDRSVSSLELEETQHAVASEVTFEQGYLAKRSGRTPVGDTLATPLNGKILKLFIFEKLDGNQALLAFTATKVYTWRKGDASWTDITGTAQFSANNWSVVRYVNKVYFTTDGTEDIYYWDIGSATITALAAGYTGKALAVYGERLHILNTYESSTWNRQRDRWSNVGNTTFSVNDFNDLVSYMGEDGIEHADLLASSLILYGSNTIVEVSYTGSTTTPFAYRLCSTGAGLASPRAFVNLGDSHAYFSGDGIKLFDMGLVPKPLDAKVNSWLFEVLNADFLDECVMTYCDASDELVFYYPQVPNTACSHFLALDLATGVWTEGERGATCGCSGSLTGRQSINELIGTLDSLTGTIDFQGAPLSQRVTYIGTAGGGVYSEFEGPSVGTVSVQFDLQTKDFNFSEDVGAVWMGLEFEARGDFVDVSYSLDQGLTWTYLGTSGQINDLSGTIDAQTTSIDELGTEQTLTGNWTRYRLDFEGVGKTCRFRFENRTAGRTVQLRWYRPFFLITSPVGTLPT